MTMFQSDFADLPHVDTENVGDRLVNCLSSEPFDWFINFPA